MASPWPATPRASATSAEQNQGLEKKGPGKIMAREKAPKNIQGHVKIMTLESNSL
jgi:hypothetical protein